MTYKELVQRFRQETNYANTGPTTVTGQKGDHARAVSWIADAYTEIQNRHRWRWLRKKFTLTTSSGSASYDYTSAQDDDSSSAISRFKEWAIRDRWNPVECYLQSAGSGTSFWLTYIPWESYRSIYEIGNQTNGAPAHITIDPSDNIVLGPTPGDTYVVKAEYHKGPQVLAADDDVPEMPSAYHMLIVYTAMEDGGFFDSADEVVARAQRKGRRLMRQLESTQLPKMRMAGPLA